MSLWTTQMSPEVLLQKPVVRREHEALVMQACSPRSSLCLRQIPCLVYLPGRLASIQVKTDQSHAIPCRFQPIFDICEHEHHCKHGLSIQLDLPFLELSLQAPEMYKAQFDSHHYMFDLTVPSRRLISTSIILMSITVCISATDAGRSDKQHRLVPSLVSGGNQMMFPS